MRVLSCDGPSGSVVDTLQLWLVLDDLGSNDVLVEGCWRPKALIRGSERIVR